MTNQEKIEIKVRALKLAEDLDEAKEIYAFLVDGLDDDPLRLDTPSPSISDAIKDYCRTGRLPDAFFWEKISASPEQKTTGLNFMEAMQAVFSGKTILRPDSGQYIMDENRCLKMGPKHWYPILFEEDFLATDWQIINTE